MREGISVLAELVDRIEAGEVRVEDASLRRAEGTGLDVDLSVHIPDDAGTDRLARGATAGEKTSPPPDESTAVPDGSSGAPGPSTPADPPAFGARSVRIGESLDGDHAPARNGAGGAEPDGEAPADTPDEAGEEGTSDDESVECRVEGCGETFATEHGMKIHATKAHREADGSGPSPHRDPERLREVYEAHDTFDEMTEALDVDVTAQTVRRSMMSLDIHDPDAAAGSRRSQPERSTDEAVSSPSGEADGEPTPSGGADQQPTASASDGDSAEVDADPSMDADESTDVDPSEQASMEPDPSAETSTDADEADDEPLDAAEAGAEQTGANEAGTEPTDVGEDGTAPAEVDDGSPDGPPVEAVLPPDVDADVLVTAVQDASTVFQVQRAMGVEREEAQTLLAELDLLDLVTGRVATEDERDVSREEVERRIVETATGDGDERGDERADPPVGAE